MQRNLIIHTLMVRTATLENSLTVSYKTKSAITTWHSNCLLGIYLKEMKAHGDAKA